MATTKTQSPQEIKEAALKALSTALPGTQEAEEGWSLWRAIQHIIPERCKIRDRNQVSAYSVLTLLQSPKPTGHRDPAPANNANRRS